MPTHPLANDPHQTIVDFIDSGKPFAIATVLNDAGSTPRKAGTKAIVDSTGSIWGTIGGGLLEDQAKRMAVESITTKQPVVFDFKFAGTSAGENKPICGGNMRVLIDPTAAHHRNTYAQAAEARRYRRRGVLITSIQEQDDVTRVQMRWSNENATAPAMSFPTTDDINRAMSVRTAKLVVCEHEWQTDHF